MDTVTGATVFCSASFGTISVATSPAAVLSSAISVTPAKGEISNWASVVVTVSNTGSANATTVVPYLAVTGGAALVSAILGPTPAPPVSLTPGTMQSFTWTYSLSGVGTATFSANATGINAPDSSVINSSLTSATIAISAQTPGALLCNIATAPSSFLMGDIVSVTLTVKNTGGKTVTGVMPSMAAGASDALAIDACGHYPMDSTSEKLRLSGPSIAGPFPLLPGETKTISWTYSAYGGTPDYWTVFTSSVTGIDSLTGNPLLSCASATINFPPPARLGCSLAVSPKQVAIGERITVTSLLTNTGSFALTGVLPALSTVSGGTLVTPYTTSGGAQGLTPGQSRSWVWTYTAVKSGTVTFKASSTGSAGTDTANCDCTADGEITLAVGDGEVKVLGGIRGYISKTRGEQANILVRTKEAGSISIDIYDMRGRLVRHISANTSGGRTESIKWDSRDSSGTEAVTGTYPVHITGPGGINVRDRIVVLH